MEWRFSLDHVLLALNESPSEKEGKCRTVSTSKPGKNPQ